MAILGNNNLVRRNGRDLAAFSGQHNGVGISRHFLLQPGAYERGLGNDQRHALTLHVRSHQRPVCVVVFKEGDEAGCYRHQLFRRNVHVIHFGGIDFEKVAAVAHRNFFPGEMSASVHRRIGLRHEEILFAVGGKVFNLVAHAAFFHLPIRRLDKTKLIDARESAHRTD